MSGLPPEPVPLRPPTPDAPADPGEVAAAGRSCLVILLLAAAVLLLLCVGLAARWAAIN